MNTLHCQLFFHFGPTGEQIQIMMEGLFVFQDDSKWPNLLQEDRYA